MVYCASLAAIMTAAITLEEVREVGLVNRLYNQNGGVGDNLNPMRILIDFDGLNELNKRIDYLKQRGVNTSLPLINFYNRNLTL